MPTLFNTAMAVIASVWSVARASGTTIEYTISGTVDRMTSAHAEPWDHVAIGDRFTVVARIPFPGDDIGSDDPTLSVYVGDYGAVRIGDATTTESFVRLGLENDYVRAGGSIYSDDFDLLVPATSALVVVSMRNWTPTPSGALISDAQPLSLTPSDFDEHVLRLYSSSDYNGGVFASIDTFDARLIPAPYGITPMMLGLLAFTRRTRLDVA